MAGVRLKNISKRFGKNVWAIRNFNLTVEDGEFMVLLGPSGCGKTTALRIICGLEEPTSGQVYIGGKDLTNTAPGRRETSMVFQAYAIWPHMKVYNNIAFGLTMKKTPKDETMRRVKEVAELVKIQDLLDRYPHQLSGGQRQRIALARALVVNPRVFLMDEPFSNLDAQLRMKMRTDLKYIHKCVRATTVFVTHDQSEAMSMADRITVMKDGNIEQAGTPEEIYFKPANTFVAGFIGSPTMNMLEMQVNETGGTLSLVSHSIKLPLPKDIADIIKEKEPAVVTLGIRPQDVHCCKQGEETCKAEVFVVEPQGAEKIVALKLKDGTVIKSLAGADVPLKPGQIISVSMDYKKLHLFNPDDGSRIDRC